MFQSGRIKNSLPLFDLQLWNQYEKALTGSQKTNNSVEGWHRAFQHGMGFSSNIGQNSVIPKEGTKLDRSEEVKNACIQAGEQPRKDAKYGKPNERLKTILSNYQNNRILSLLEGLASNFELQIAFVLSNYLIRYRLCFNSILI